MTFIKISMNHGAGWWLWNKETMEAININGGGFTIDENAPYFMNSEVRDFDSWHDLYSHTHYNPFLSNFRVRDCWLSPDGEFWEAEAHAVQAEKICSLVYGVEFDLLDWADAADYLIDKGWKKLTPGPMWQFYISDVNMNWDVNNVQQEAIKTYCEFHSIKLPPMRIL